MHRPLLVTDCDEVLLHMVVPFREWLEEVHYIDFDFTGGSFSEALRHKLTGDLVKGPLVWELLGGFFETEMYRQYPIEGAVDSLNAVAQLADVVILTNIGEFAADGRVDQLRRAGIDFPVIANRGGKGQPLSDLIQSYRPSVTVFVDDLAEHHASSARHAPQAWRLHMVGEPELAPHIAPAPEAHVRIDGWTEARQWIETVFARGEQAA